MYINYIYTIEEESFYLKHMQMKHFKMSLLKFAIIIVS